MKYYLFLLFAFFLSLSACTKDAEIIGSKLIQPKLVLDCTFSAHKPVEAYLSANAYILDTTLTTIDNATIILFENEQIVDTLSYKGKGCYASTFKPIPENHYSIEASANGFKTASAQDTIPGAGFNISILSFQKHVTVIEGIRFDLLSLMISDEDPSTNYFELDLYNIYDEDLEYIDLFYVSSPVASFKNWENGARTLLFTDDCFNNNSLELDVFIHKNENDPPAIKFRKVSRQYFEFKNKLYAHHYTKLTNKETIDELFKGEPVNMFSNIKNGYGIFAGYIEIVR